MPRKAAPLFFAAIALAILATLGWIKWNERGSDARLRADLERKLLFDGQVRFAECDLSGLTVRNLKINRRKNPCEFTAELVIPRRRFATTAGVGTSSNHSFQPTGTAVLPLVGAAQLSRQRLAILPFLGEIHPVWSWSYAVVNVDTNEPSGWTTLVEGGPNALFDESFRHPLWGAFTKRQMRDDLGLLARPELRRSGRLDESAALWSLDPRWTSPFESIHDPANAPYLAEATLLLHALEKAGPGHHSARRRMQAILK